VTLQTDWLGESPPVPAHILAPLDTPVNDWSPEQFADYVIRLVQVHALGRFITATGRVPDIEYDWPEWHHFVFVLGMGATLSLKSHPEWPVTLRASHVRSVLSSMATSDWNPEP